MHRDTKVTLTVFGLWFATIAIATLFGWI